MTLQNTARLHHVVVYHYVDTVMGHPVNGPQTCGNNKLQTCLWRSDNDLSKLRVWFDKDISSTTDDMTTTTVSVYNIHNWIGKGEISPDLCSLNTTLTLAESEESRKHRSRRTEKAFLSYDGYSTTENTSSLQRAYTDIVDLNPTQLLPAQPFSTLIKGASFTASNCLPKLRNALVLGLRDNGFRVDGLATCLKTQSIPEGVTLNVKEDVDQHTNYATKKAALGRYLFHLAFENDIESWHITEKAYHAMHAGTVPVYLGPSEDFKQLLPHPKAVIFVADFDYNTTALATYLTQLSHNETAYEEHRLWRKTFSRNRYIAGKPYFVQQSWHCRVCEWAMTTRLTTPRPSKVWCDALPSWFTILLYKVITFFFKHWFVFLRLGVLWAFFLYIMMRWWRQRRNRWNS